MDMRCQNCFSMASGECVAQDIWFEDQILGSPPTTASQGEFASPDTNEIITNLSTTSEIITNLSYINIATINPLVSLISPSFLHIIHFTNVA